LQSVTRALFIALALGAAQPLLAQTQAGKPAAAFITLPIRFIVPNAPDVRERLMAIAPKSWRIRRRNTRRQHTPKSAAGKKWCV
jgi:hypothetical protein